MAERTPILPSAQLPLDEWLKKFARDRMLMSKRGEDVRTQTTVALQRRFRGASLSDQIGCFVPGGTGMWRGDQVEDLDGLTLKCINITKPAVQMGMAALSSARVAINNEPTNKEPALKGAANVADGISQFLDADDHHWSGGLVSRMMQMIQTGYGAFVQAKHNPNKKADYVATQDWPEEQTSMPGEYACECGAGGPFDHEMEADGEPPETIDCPECGKTAEVTKYPEIAAIPIPGEMEKTSLGDIETNLSSSLEHRVDERRSQGGNLLLAEWFEHDYLVTNEQLDEDFPDFNFGQAGDWSYKLKWKWALETGDDIFASNYQAEDYRTRHERRDIYVLPAIYASRIEPADCEICDAHGNVVFSVKRGDRLIEKCPEGFCFSMVGEILAPYWREVDFRCEWSYCCYVPDAHSFWGQPLVGLLQIQDDFNTMYTIDMQHRERNSLTQIIHNNQAFDPDAFENDIVSTAEGWTQENPLDYYFQQVSPAPMAEAMTGLQFLYSILPYVGGAPQEAIGVDPPGAAKDNYSAQLLRQQSTLRQLQPAGESNANCKVHHFRNFYKLAQKHWSPERLEYIRTRFGEEWKEDDIEAFLNCNIERDLVSNYIEGTEVPTSFVERVVKIEGAITKYLEASQPPPEQLLRQWFDMNDIDYDLGGLEADERLADARYETIKQGLKELTGHFSDAPTVDPMSGQPGPSELVMAVMSHPQLNVLPKENHKVAVEFYVAREKATMAQEMPDLNLIGCLEEIIKRHEMGGVDETQNQNMQMMEGEAPIIEAQQAMQGDQPDPAAEAQAQAQAQADLQAQQQQVESEEAAIQREADAEEAEMTHQREMEKMDKEQANARAMKLLELTSKERTAKFQSKAKTKQRPAA